MKQLIPLHLLLHLLLDEEKGNILLCRSVVEYINIENLKQVGFINMGSYPYLYPKFSNSGAEFFHSLSKC